jgi:hypothetical protein
MAEFSAPTIFTILGGQFQITSSLNGDGKVIKDEISGAGIELRLQDIVWTQASAPGASPFLALRTPAAGAARRRIILDGMVNWAAYMTGATNGLDVATRGATDQTYIYFSENAQSAGSAPLKIAQNFLFGSGTDWDWNRFDFDHIKLTTGAGTVTLTANAATTTVNNTTVTTDSLVFLFPTSANAAADVGSAGSVYISAKVAATSFTITHPNNANTDKTFNYLIIN